MRRPAVLFFCIGPLLMLGIVTLNPVMILLAVPMIIMLAVGIWQSTNAIEISAERTLSDLATQTGNTIDVSLTVRNNGARFSEIHLEDYIPRRLYIEEGDPVAVQPLRPNETITIAYKLGGRRGLYRLPKLRATSYDLFGNVQQSVEIVVDGETTFQFSPKYLGIDDVPIRPKNTHAFAGYIPARIPGSGIDFFGVRGYRQGDSLRHINWRAVSRRPDSIFTNEFEQLRVADVGLIVDARERAISFAGDTELLEHKIMAASAFSETLTGLGNRVSLLVYGSYLNWTLPGYGKRQHQQILRNLTTTGVGKSEVFQALNHLPTRLFPAKSQLIIFSTLLPEDVAALRRMRARGYSVMVISPNPVALEAAMLDASQVVPIAKRMAHIDRALLIRQVRQVGVQVVDWDVSNSLPEAVRAQARPMHGGLR